MIEYFDQLPKVHRDFINEYGWVAFHKWDQRRSLRQHEITVRVAMNLSATSPVVDEYERRRS